MLKNQISQRDELLIQRCIDDELTPEQTRHLLRRLDELSDGWKTLACGFLEDRLVGRSVRAELGDLLGDTLIGENTAEVVAIKPVAPATKLTNPAPIDRPRILSRQKVSFWWAHPVTSLSLCAAIAFVSGMLLPDFASWNQPEGTTVARNSGPSSGGVGGVAADNRSTAGRPSPQGRLVLSPGNSSGQSPVEIPIFKNFEEFNPYTTVRGQQIDVNSVDKSRLATDEDQGPIQVIRVPIDDKKDALFFYRDHVIADPVQ